jgi:hypothetical protein
MIDKYSFGRMTIQGRTYTSDLTIIGGLVRDNWWRKSGHVFRVEDLFDVVRADPEVLVLGTGSSGMARPAPDLESELLANGIRLVALPTPQAVIAFNDLHARGADAAGGFHLTC